MDKKSNNLVIVIILIGMTALLLLGIIFSIYLKSNKTEEQNFEKNDIESLLNSNLIFQNSIGVGSNFSGLYNFKDDGTFTFSDKEVVTNNNQILFMKGNWKYSNGLLTLIIQEEYRALNGIIINDVIQGEILKDYEIVKYNLDNTKKYKIKLNNDDGIKYIDGDLILYEVHLSEEEKSQYFDESSLENSNEILSKTFDISKYVTLKEKKESLSTYNIDLVSATKDANVNDSLTFNIGDNYKVRLLLTELSNFILFDIYVNDVNMGNIGKFILDGDGNFPINLLGKYLIYLNWNFTDIKSQRIFVVNNTKLYTIYELDNVEGMQPTKIDITPNGISVEGSRITHGPSIEYGQDIYMILSKEECDTLYSKLSKDLVIKSTYNYSFDDGILNFNPNITNSETLEDYTNNQNNDVCNEKNG